MYRFRNYNGLQAAAISKCISADAVHRLWQFDFAQTVTTAEHLIWNGNDVIRYNNIIQPFAVRINTFSHPKHRTRNRNRLESGTCKGVFSDLLNALRQHCRNQLWARLKCTIANFFECVGKYDLLELCAAGKRARVNDFNSVRHNCFSHFALRKRARHDPFYNLVVISVRENDGFLVLTRKSGDTIASVHLCIAEQVPILPACVRMAVCLNCRSCTAFCAADLNVARFM